MDATPVLAAILRDARKSALLRMRSEVLFPFNCQTANRRASAFPRRDAFGACVDCPPPKTKRAQGKPGARCTRGLVCKVHKRMRTRAYRSSGGNPAFPARWFTAYSALSLVTGLSCHHRPQEILLPANLTPASGRQDHTASPSADSGVRLSPPLRPPHPTARS